MSVASRSLGRSAPIRRVEPGLDNLVRTIIIIGILMSLCALAAQASAMEDAPHGDSMGGAHGSEMSGGHDDDHARISDEKVQLSSVVPPERPRLLLELGEKFLGAGELGPRWHLPTGAVWHPAFWVYGTWRNAAQTFDGGATRTSELASRLDLFGNVRFSGTERLLIGLRPLDRGNGRFTRYLLSPAPVAGQDRFTDEFNVDLQTFFFEGDIGEIFPRLDPDDSGRWDIYFSIGKQPIVIQDGFLVNDTITGVAASRINDHFFGAASFRTTGFYGWQDLNRGTNLPGGILEDGSAAMYAMFTEADFRLTTMNFDTVYINASDEMSGDALFTGVSFNQRFGHVNTIFRVNASIPMDTVAAPIVASNLVGRGALTTAEVSWNAEKSHDLFYANGFWADRHFTSAARDPLVGGPLGRIGISFAAQGLGSYGTPLSNQAQHAVGGAFGYQKFLTEDQRKQLIFELAGRTDTDDTDQAAAAFVVRYQQAFGRRWLLQADAFVSDYEALTSDGSGLRVESQLKF